VLILTKISGYIPPFVKVGQITTLDMKSTTFMWLVVVMETVFPVRYRLTREDLLTR